MNMDSTTHYDVLPPSIAHQNNNMAEDPTVVVVGPQFCAPYTLDLNIVKKSWEFKYEVIDSNGNIVFRLKHDLLRGTRTLLDHSGNTILTIQRQVLSRHDRWDVFGGEREPSHHHHHHHDQDESNTHHEDLLFTVKQSSLIHIKKKHNVFLGTSNNLQQSRLCDFKIKSSLIKKSCFSIYAGDDSHTAIAKTCRKHILEDAASERDNFIVTVFPNVDHAFIVALFVIVLEIKAREDI